MNPETFNMSIRKFLKSVGVQSQREIEEAVQSHANIAEVAVVGVADALKGQMPLALSPTSEALPEDALLAALGHDPVSLDALQARCGWPTAQLQAQLMELELLGQVGRLPGGLFQRLGRA